MNPETRLTLHFYILFLVENIFVRSCLDPSLAFKDSIAFSFAGHQTRCIISILVLNVLHSPAVHCVQCTGVLEYWSTGVLDHLGDEEVQFVKLQNLNSDICANICRGSSELTDKLFIVGHTLSG